MEFDYEKYMERNQKMLENSFEMAKKSIDVAAAVMTGSLGLIQSSTEAAMRGYKDLFRS